MARSPIVERLEARAMRTAKLERTEPLPVGRYWIDLFPAGAVCESCPDGGAVFNEWRAAHKDAVRVITTEHYNANEDENLPSRDWILFEVLQPTPWEQQKKIGWPTVAEKGTNTSSDTASGTGPTSTWDYWFGDGGGEGGDTGPLGMPKWIVPVGVVLIGVILVGFAARSVASAASSTRQLAFGS